MAFTFKHGDRPLEGYTIQRGVGRGGFGEVYYAVSDGGREVALKYLRDNPAIELRGVSHCMNLKSPHLVTIFDVKQNSEGDYFVIMEYVQGPSLRDLLIAEPEGLSPQKAAFFIRELAKGLGYLHERGIVHRDMKPGNIFYEDGYVKIGDYGLSKFISVSRHSAQTASIGTVHYMAPEVGSGDYHRGIDIYALGVMLYEMLLGRVPYDGATMGEVLMKHLTAQPEVDELPEPFGEVIRKALAKDPKDRYQSVEEMAEEILGVGEVRDSLAGFNPHSLTAAAGAVRPDRPTPFPSPNPPPPPPPPKGVRVGWQSPDGLRRAHLIRAQGPVVGELSERLARRAQRIGEKVTRRRNHLERKHGRRRPRHQGAPYRSFTQGLGRAKHWVIAILLILGIATGVGLLAGIVSGHGTLGASAGLGVLMMSTGVIASRKVTSWLGQAAQPVWVHRLATLGCCGALLAIAMTPVMAATKHVPTELPKLSYTGTSFEIDETVRMIAQVSDYIRRPLFPGAPMTLLALILTAMLVDWEKRLEHGAAGEMSVGQAFTAGLCAFIFTAIFSQGNDRLMFMAAGVAAATSFAVQGVAWFVPLRGLYSLAPSLPKGNEPAGAAAAPPVPPVAARVEAAGERIGQHVSGTFDRLRHAVTHWAGEPAEGQPGIPMALPVEQDSPHARLASSVPLPPLRHTATRAFWSVVSFLLLAGAVVSFLSTVLVKDIRCCTDDRQGFLTLSVACCALLGFALRKTGLRKRPTFWQNTLRPFLFSLTVIGMGAPIIALSVQPHLCDEARLGSISGLVLSGVLFLFLLLVARGRGSAPAPFLVGESGADSGRPAAEAPAGWDALDAPAEQEIDDERGDAGTA